MKFYILFFSLFFSTIQLVNSQNQQNIDSLLKIYSSTKVDSIRLKTNNRITSYYLYRDINKAKSYAIKQLKLAKQIENIKGEINALYDQETFDAVMQFQAAEGLYPYGVMDFTTQSALNNRLRLSNAETDKQLMKAYQELTKEDN